MPRRLSRDEVVAAARRMDWSSLRDLDAGAYTISAPDQGEPMSIRITDGATVALYDSVEGLAFGPTFESDAHAQDFLAWMEGQPDRRALAVAAPTWKLLHQRWFDERVDGVSGALKGVV